MSFREIFPVAKKGAVAAVTVRATPGSRYGAALSVTVRPALIAGAAPVWWNHGAAVSVSVGEGEHAGWLRLSPGGVWRLSGGRGKLAKAGVFNAPSLRIRGLPDLPPEPSKAIAADYRAEGTVLMVRMPWAEPASKRPVRMFENVAVTPKGVGTRPIPLGEPR